jgi:hypothetical protein
MKVMAIAIASKGVPPAPVARVEVVKDSYFGETPHRSISPSAAAPPAASPSGAR